MRIRIRIRTTSPATTPPREHVPNAVHTTLGRIHPLIRAVNVDVLEVTALGGERVVNCRVTVFLRSGATLMAHETAQQGGAAVSRACEQVYLMAQRHLGGQRPLPARFAARRAPSSLRPDALA